MKRWQGLTWGTIAIALVVGTAMAAPSLKAPSFQAKESGQASGAKVQPGQTDRGQPRLVAEGSGLDLRLRAPIDCQIGRDCFVLLYPDRDPSPGEFDYQCGNLSYNGHDGTDFALAYRDPQTAVRVVAAASARVRAIRDGVVDRRIDSPEGIQRIQAEKIECGNGVLTERDDGWQLQYCHMKQGSIAVKPGDRVEAGQMLGLVGESGMTTFPHVHLTVRYQGRAIDPWVGLTTATGCSAAHGGQLPTQDQSSLWADRSLAYVPTGLIRSGFSSQAPDESDLWRGEYRSDRLSRTAPALIFWVFAYGVQVGDRETYRLIAPDGSVRVNLQESIAQSRKTWLKYVGQATRRAPLMPGVWQASYQLERQGKTIVQTSQRVTID